MTPQRRPLLEHEPLRLHIILGMARFGAERVRSEGAGRRISAIEADGRHLLVWAERRETMYDAIAWEKQIKAGARAKKLALIEAMNPEWRDLYEALV